MRRKTLKYKKMRLLISAAVIYLFLLLISAALANLIRGPLLANLISISTLDEDTVAETVPVQALLIKTEYLLRASIGGEVDFLVRDGERVSSGAAVAEIHALSLDNNTGTVKAGVFAPVAGTFCSHLDGLEEVLTPSAINSLDLTQIVPPKTELTANIKDDNITEKGQAIGKLIDNLQRLLIYLSTEEHLPAKLLDSGSTVKLNYQDSRFDAQVVQAVKSRPLQIVLSAANYPDSLIHRRNVELTLVLEELNGLLVAADSLVYKNNQPGLFIVYKQRAMWVPVEIAGVLKNKVAVKSERLNDGIRYIINPHLVSDGEQL